MTQEQAIGIALGVAAAVYIIGCVCYMKLKHLLCEFDSERKLRRRVAVPRDIALSIIGD